MTLMLVALYHNVNVAAIMSRRPRGAWLPVAREVRVHSDVAGPGPAADSG